MHTDMKKLYITLIACLVFLGFNQSSIAQVVNYYGSPDTISFNKVNYKLSWSSHPTETFYKHEYLPKGENENDFENMVLIDFIQGDFTTKDVVGNKISELQQRKLTDGLCNYEVIKNKNSDDYTLDFIMSVSENNYLKIVEWNCYRYKYYVDSAGHKGVILFGVSKRAYGKRGTYFLRALPNQRLNIRKLVLDYPIPEIQIK